MPRRKNIQCLLLPLALVGAIALIYRNIFGFDFVYDDDLLIVDNQFLTSAKFLGRLLTSTTTGGIGIPSSFYRPLQMLSYFVVNAVFGAEPLGFHLLNLAIHMATALMVWKLGRRLGLSTTFAFFAALLWAVHPMHIESVTYMSGTADSLHTLFFILGLWVLLPDFTPRKIGWAFAAFLAALLTKEAAVTFPVLMGLVIFLASDRRYEWKTYLKTWPFWLAIAIYLPFHARYFPQAGNFSVYKDADLHASHFAFRMATFFATLPCYAKLILWPSHLGIERVFPVYTTFWSWPVIVGGLMALAPVILFFRAVIQKTRWPWAAWGGISFLALYFPTSGVLFPANNLFMEHWLYLPSIPLFLTAAFLAERYLSHTFKYAGAVAATVAAVALGVITYNQNFVWKNRISLFSSILSYNPDLHRIRHNLALAYWMKGDTATAIRENLLVLEKTQMYPQTFYNLARAYAHLGQFSLAEKYYLDGVKHDESFFPFYRGLARLYWRMGDKAKAQEAQQRYERLRPEDGPLDLNTAE